MGARQRFVISLAEVADADEPLVGGKAARLATLARAGFAVPEGFCLTIEAYQRFLTAAHLGDLIGMELGRKAFGDMRWEEIWDASLRIRSAFTAAAVPPEIASEIADAMSGFPLRTRWAVRSTAPGEDSSQRSFAGLHESYLGVTGFTPVLDAVRLVWASLWSDAAMLYRHELALDPRRSSMAVLLQPMRSESVSGMAFGRDPMDSRADQALIEAVPGLCSGLVDGEVEPDRWRLKRFACEVIGYQPVSMNIATNRSRLRWKNDLPRHAAGGRSTGTSSSRLPMACAAWPSTTTMPCVPKILTNSSGFFGANRCWRSAATKRSPRSQTRSDPTFHSRSS
jgi:phosphoenolpyruvate synthase/pyruvate phosphate dikinase